MRCLVYFNRPDRYAAIHRETCDYPQLHGGLRAATETGWYSRVLPTFEDAQVLATRQGGKIILCGDCDPHREE